jgi:hypothetical protein
MGAFQQDLVDWPFVGLLVLGLAGWVLSVVIR